MAFGEALRRAAIQIRLRPGETTPIRGGRVSRRLAFFRVCSPVGRKALRVAVDGCGTRNEHDTMGNDANLHPLVAVV